VLIDWPDDFDRWLTTIEEDGGPVEEITLALLEELAQLEGEPEVETATFKRVRQAKRHRLWRIAHPYEPDIALRIICWFESHRIVIALVGFNKAKLGDVWYTSAAVRAEALVDQWRRTHPSSKEGPS
jgi:hypothetical protein